MHDRQRDRTPARRTPRLARRLADPARGVTVLAACAVALAFALQGSEPVHAQAQQPPPGAQVARFVADGTPSEICISVDDTAPGRVIQVQLGARGSQAVAERAAPPAAPVQFEQASASLDAAQEAPVARQPRPRKLALLVPYVLGGSSLALLGTGIGLGVAGRRELDDLRRVCSDRDCGGADGARGRRLYVAADVAFGLSAGLAVAAAWLYFAGFGGERLLASRARGPRLSVSGKGGALAWVGAF